MPSSLSPSRLYSQVFESSNGRLITPLRAFGKAGEFCSPPTVRVRDSLRRLLRLRLGPLLPPRSHRRSSMQSSVRAIALLVILLFASSKQLCQRKHSNWTPV